MHRTLIEQHFALAERHIAQGERTVARQRALVAELERDGRDTALAQAMLEVFEQVLATQRADRERIQRELQG